tara:strand:- start:16672 stop:16848 length:177 start_codon:yes stop_codon:yes gene_type:complete
MSDKIPYSKVNKSVKPAASPKVKTSSIKSNTNSGAGKGDKPRHDISAYSDNYDDINWG